MRILLVLCCIALYGCETMQKAFMPTPVRCAPKETPTPPKITSKVLLDKMDDYHYVLIVGAERLELISYAAQAAPIIQACQ